MNKGYTIILNVLFLAIISTLIVAGVVNPLLSHHSTANAFIQSKKAFLLSGSAANEALYRLKTNKTIGASTPITLSSSTATITVTTTATGKDIVVTAPGNEYQRNIKIGLTLGNGISFHYGIQGGQGGFILQNTSSITGNVFSAGSITGSNNIIRGDVISAGAAGLISGIHATGTAFAHTIDDSTIDKDAYYTNITNTTVGRTSYPGSPDQDMVDLPISDAQIAEWEDFADDGGVVTCTSGKYVINSNTTIGPKKIPCNLEIKGVGIVVTIAGPIWVTGNIDLQNSPTIKISSALGNQNVAIIADNPSNRLTSSIITLGQSSSFEGSGSAGSYVFMISQNNASELGNATEAIVVGQSSNALVAYASHGLISLSQSVGLKEVTAYKIILKNSANVTYDTGLASSLFSAGPGGGYNQLEWREF
jgi:hypothetical protein